MRVVNVMAGIMNTAIVGGFLFACTNVYEAEAREIKCLADNIYFEALTESEAGQIAVANVTMNRVKNPAFPNSVCEVVWEPKQFSWTHDGKSDTPSSKKHYDEVYEIAKAVYYGNIVDITEGATFYHADYVDPPWAKVMQRVAKIDTHIFYKHEGR
jgi:spore germination cell wall hydrolase CwlJ-like protein